MKLYIDGDALPNRLKPILYRAIERLNLETFVVSNKRISIGLSKHITYVLVASGADEADNHIVELVTAGDLVITSDIPLADRVISKNAYALSHHGKFFDEDNIKQSLAIRNFMESIRESGVITKGNSPFSEKDAREFANKLNQFFRKLQ